MLAMANEPSDAVLKDAHDAVTRQGDAVRALKAAVKEGTAQKVHLMGSIGGIISIAAVERSSAGSRSQLAADHAACMQADVDGAIQKLKDLKVAAEKLQKVALYALRTTLK